nr:hypothetical protein [Aeromonas dhakensis]
MNSRYPELAPAQAWQLAYQWICRRRRHYRANADIWHLRFHWPARSATLFARVMAGHYRLSPMQLLGGHAIWSAEDALVLKWVALRVAPRLPWHPACEHGRGMGVVASRRRLHDFLQGAGGSHPYVLRTDIRGYYQHIDRARVLSRLVAPLPCPVCRELMRQYLYYSVECGGEFHTPGGGDQPRLRAEPADRRQPAVAYRCGLCRQGGALLRPLYGRLYRADPHPLAPARCRAPSQWLSGRRRL